MSREYPLTTNSETTPSRTSVIAELASRLLTAGCDDREAQRLLRAALLAERLERAGGNVCRAAREAHTHRNTFSRQLKDAGIEGLPAIIREERRKGGLQMGLWKKLPGSIRSSRISFMRGRAA